MIRVSSLLALALMLQFSPAMAQEPAITAADRARLVQAAAKNIRSAYFDAAVGADVAARLQRARYDTCATIGSFTTAVTRDLQLWARDRHLKLAYSPAPITTAMLSGDAGDESARNFGFYDVKRLSGNVGYIELGRFSAAAQAGAVLQSVMQFVSNTDALIIDLRQNGGGHADMVALVTSYFIDEQKLLATLEHRAPLSSAQIWSASYVAGPRYLGKPVYVLTSGRTFSAAEGLAYDLRYFAKATIVGEKTRGGANPGLFHPLDEHFAVLVPQARVVHAATGSNWDADGITPDVTVAAADASRSALKLALESLMKEKKADARFAMWKDAYDDMFPVTQKP